MSHYDRRSNSQQLVLAALVALLVGLAIGAAVGFGTGWLTQRQTPAHTAPQAPPASSNNVTVGGASRVVDGIGVGFTHDEQGAVLAARQAAELVAGPDALDDARWATVRRQVFANGAPGSQSPANVRQSYGSLFGWPNGRLPDGGLLSVTPVSWRTVDYSVGSARIDIWGVLVGGSPSTSRFREVWFGGTYEMRWERGDWRFWDGASWGNAEQAVPLPAQPATPEQGLPARLRGMHAF